MRPPTSRRSLIRESAMLGCALLAGCTGTFSSSDESDSPATADTTETETETRQNVSESTTSTSDDHPEITDVWTQQSVIYLAASAHRRVEGVAGKQLVLALGSETIPRSDLELRLGDTQYPSVSTFGDAHVGSIVVDEQVTDDQQVVGFAVPRDVEVEQGVIEWTTDENSATWQLSESVVHSITNPPEFEVTEFTTPDRVGPDETFTVSTTIANRGGTGGIFRAELGTSARSDGTEVRIFVESDEQTSWSKTIDVGGNDETELAVTLDWGFDSRTETVQRASDTTTQ